MKPILWKCNRYALFTFVVCLGGNSCADKEMTADADPDKDKVPTLTNLHPPGGALEVMSPIERKPLRDAAGVVNAYLPLPENWKVTPATPGFYTIAAPGGVTVGETRREEYAYSDDQFVRQTLQTTGKTVAPLHSVEQIIEKSLVPGAATQGYSLVKQYPLPEVQEFWDAYSAAIPKTGTVRRHRVVATDWKDEKGGRLLVVILQSTIQNPEMLLWSVSCTELESPAASFETAKEIYLAGLAHTLMDEDWQRAKGYALTDDIRRNQREADEWIRNSQESHRKNLADIASAGRTSRAIGAASSAILDRSHEGFRQRTGETDSGHSRSVDGIHERTIIANEESGKRYEVESGYNYYWADGQGGYFGTDDPNLDPRTDFDASDRGREWSRYEPES